MKTLPRLLFMGIILVLLGGLMPVSQASGQTSGPRNQALNLLASMTPEERVGQLFLVTFKGRDVSASSLINDLIARHHIGGVILKTSNDNFTGPNSTITEAYTLTTSLQRVEFNASQKSNQPAGASRTVLPQYAPLLIGIAQEGDSYPNDQIINGLTTLPNEMAIGATWKPELAQQVGQVMGQELSALGINLLMGPSLDVLDVMHTDGSEDLGTRTFGGDPYWVGEMGKAYITGLHEGSQNHLAVIATHFPGRGGSDRLPEEEVATVRKSLEQLKQIELAPFFAVTGNAPTPLATTDGLLVSHIRYQGFQGNVRATTRPVSLDSAALGQLLKLDAFAGWRNLGGVVVSDDLGSPAVRKFYDPTGITFDARQVARTAFMAGNDLLYVDNITSKGDPDSYTTILHMLDFFAQKYREDPAFAQAVDKSAERILTLKFRLYPSFTTENVLPSQQGLNALGSAAQVSFDVARSGATLISPDQSEVSTSLTRPPDLTDRIVFITDLETGRQCTNCPDQTVLALDGLQNTILRLYGPRTGSQVLGNRLSSYSYNDLLLLLNGNLPQNSPVESDVQLANYVVFASLNLQSTRAESFALKRFLNERGDLLRNKKLIVFAFNAPYYLDATDISKLTAYYGLYSKSAAFVEIAARILFQEITPTGALPVSVPGVGYDLINATAPDSTQVIPLFLDMPEPIITPNTAATAKPTAVPTFRVGDTLPLRTGAIYDHNRHTVPDGTVVRFLFTVSGGEGGTVQQIETTTLKGVARSTYRIQVPGVLDIRVTSDPALSSEILRLDVTGTKGGEVIAITPTLAETATLAVTATATATLAQTPPLLPSTMAGTGIASWLLLLAAIAAIIASVGLVGRMIYSLRWGVRLGLLAGVGGLLAYLLLKAAGTATWRAQIGYLGMLLIVLLGAGFGSVAGWFWRRRQEQHARTIPKGH